MRQSIARASPPIFTSQFKGVLKMATPVQITSPPTQREGSAGHCTGVCKTERRKFPPYNGHGQAKYRGQVRANLPLPRKPQRGVLTDSAAREGGVIAPDQVCSGGSCS